MPKLRIWVLLWQLHDWSDWGMIKGYTHEEVANEDCALLMDNTNDKKFWVEELKIVERGLVMGRFKDLDILIGTGKLTKERLNELERMGILEPKLFRVSSEYFIRAYNTLQVEAYLKREIEECGHEYIDMHVKIEAQPACLVEKKEYVPDIDLLAIENQANLGEGI